ncbi:hypothetical protein D6777_00755 [Candidatus Woesearchaeota archaeon]|nr:MAG: hypothetical protein D6777_00755 [Candidatus Woesearchaeota archaeon]
MAFSKSFPKTKDKYPVWIEVSLTDEEEKEVEEAARKHNLKLMQQCLEDAKTISNGLNTSSIAIALFEKLASHSVYWKERKLKEKFDQLK